MSNLRYGLKEVANVIFFDVATGKPAIFFDTLKVSTIENTSESAEARGGQGNGKLMSWDFGRTATLTMQDALLSDLSLSLLAGNATKTATETDGVKIVGREVKTVVGGKVELLQKAVGNKVNIYKLEKGVMGSEVVVFEVKDKALTSGVTVTEINFMNDAYDTEDAFVDPQVNEEEQVMVFYEYLATKDATQVTFSADKFPATYKVVGDTVVRGEDGVDRVMQFVIPKAKLQTNFTLTMEAENVSTFDFTLDVLVDTSTPEKKLYDIIRVN